MDYSKELSQIYARSTQAALQGEPEAASQILTGGEDAVRQTYLRCFKEQARKTEELGWFRSEFAKMAEQVRKEVCPEATPDTSWQIEVQSDDLSRVFTQGSMVLVGRNPQCDFMPRIKEDVSRLHAILIPLPALDKLVVLDVGSLFGILTVDRSTEEPCLITCSGRRQPLIFGLSETVKLRLGSVHITLNPKECRVCLERPRQVRLTCGHFVICRQCQVSLDTCPICREPIRDVRLTQGASSFIRRQ